MTEALREFIIRAVNSTLKLELLTYFHRNRYTMDYAEGTAHRVGADPHLVEIALEELVGVGVIHQRQSAFNVSRPPVFSYTRDETIRRLVDELTCQLQTEEGRRSIMALVEKGNEDSLELKASLPPRKRKDPATWLTGKK